MKRSVFSSALLTCALLLAGCGGGDMVGENSPTYPVPPLLKETTQKVVFSGKVLCKDKTERDVVLTIENIDRGTGDALFTVSFAGEEVKSKVPGTFREINNKSVIVNSTKFEVYYMKDNQQITNQFIFSTLTDPTTLVYSGDPSLAPVVLDPPAGGICRLAWAADGDADDSEGETVKFNTLSTQ